MESWAWLIEQFSLQFSNLSSLGESCFCDAMHSSRAVLRSCMKDICDVGLGDAAIELFFDYMGKLAQKAADAFWEEYNSASKLENESFCSVFATLVENLAHANSVLRSACENGLEGIDPAPLLTRFSAMFWSALFHGQDRIETVKGGIHRFFQFYLCKITQLLAPSDSKLDNEDEEDDGMSVESCSAEDSIQMLCGVAQVLWKLQWSRAIEDTIVSSVKELIHEKVVESAGDVFDENVLPGLRDWIETVPLRLVQRIISGRRNPSAELMPSPFRPPDSPDPVRGPVKAPHRSAEAENERDVIAMWRTRLEKWLFQEFCQLRISELFSIIREYPESQPSVAEFRTALTHFDGAFDALLAKTLRKTLSKRLLHAGATTVQVLDMWVSTVRVLAGLDGTGVILDSVSEPIQEYLRNRSDAIRCIIASLTEDTTSELYMELGRPDSGTRDASADAFDENWTPIPIDAPPHRAKNSVQQDLLCLLINVYGSRELFVSEYKRLLASRLLAATSFDIDQDVRTVELLKLRFGEAGMLPAEIMLRDVQESKRVATAVEGDLEGRQHSAVEMLIVSESYWPPVKDADVGATLHPRLEEELSQFAASFEKLKKPKKMKCFPALGNVQLEVVRTENGEQVTHDVSCCPIAASVLLHLEQKECWTVTELCGALGVSQSILIKRMRPLQPLGLFFEARNEAGAMCLQIKEPLLSTDASWAEPEEDEEEEEADVLGLDARAIEVYESFVVGMLTNFDALPLDRIHAMLGMFASGSDRPYNLQPADLEKFLVRLIRKGKMELSQGQYVLCGD